MLYTRQGDQGKTTLFCCQQKLSKSSAVVEALGAVDELNSLLGVVKVEASKKDKKLAKVLDQVQQDLFVVQAELARPERLKRSDGGQAGRQIAMTVEKVKELEKIIKEIEKKLPPIKTFFVAGGTRLSAQLDYARAMARRVERRVIKVKVSAATLAYLNRLSSLLYALARLENHKSGIKEESPRYE